MASLTMRVGKSPSLVMNSFFAANIVSLIMLMVTMIFATTTAPAAAASTASCVISHDALTGVTKMIGCNGEAVEADISVKACVNDDEDGGGGGNNATNRQIISATLYDVDRHQT